MFKKISEVDISELKIGQVVWTWYTKENMWWGDVLRSGVVTQLIKSTADGGGFAMVDFGSGEESIPSVVWLFTKKPSHKKTITIKVEFNPDEVNEKDLVGIFRDFYDEGEVNATLL